ncbi:MAG: DUF87 domain-containing protein [Clostridia bacterium]|nr:DUF87 domain-containing protein [Clostridia bacterium]
MKRILIAMDNEVLLSQIKKCGKYLVYGYDIDTKENVIEYLKKNDVDVLITKESLSGNMDFKTYIKEISKSQSGVKVIIAVNTLVEEVKGFLLANNVNNIIEGECISFSKIIEMIDSKQNIIETLQVKQYGKVRDDTNIITKQKICVFGTSGAGKSYVASLLAHHISKKYKLNTLLIDMDLQNAAIDIYNNLMYAPNSLGCLMEEIDNDSFNREVLLDYTSKGEKNGKLSFLTNNVGVYECQNRLSKDYYEKLYEEAEKNYDVVILDMPSAPFLDVVPFSMLKADKIVFVLNPNFISIRQAVKYIDLMVNVWQIDKNKIYLIINKIGKDSLTAKQISAILKDYTIVLKIDESREVEKVINGITNITGDEILDTEEFLKMLNIYNLEEIEEKKHGHKCIQNRFSRKEPRQ